MSVSGIMYGQAIGKAFNKEIDWDSDTIKVALVTSAYTPNQDTDDYWNDVVANELGTGNGYTANGLTLANCSITYTGATNKIKLDADDSQWTSATLTARYAVIYDRTPATDATRPLIGYIDFGTDSSSTNGNFTLTWDALGIFEITIA